MSRQLQRKIANRQKKYNQKQILSPASTGLSVSQLMQVQKLMENAEKSFAAEDYKAAEMLCRLLIKICPKIADPYHMLGGIALHYDKYKLAVEYFEKALEIMPNAYISLNNYGVALKLLDRHEEALKAFNKSLRIKKDYSEAMNNKGSILSVMGKVSQSLTYFERAIQSNQDFGKPYYNIATAHKFTKKDKYMDMFTEAEPKIAALPFVDQVNMHFAFGKFYEDQKDYERGFHHYMEGNRLHRSTLDYSVEKAEKMMETLAQIFPEGENWAKQHSAGNPSEVPIFILGMPRSGTTLVEQILASHPEVYGAGELKLTQNIINGLNIDNNAFVSEDPIVREEMNKELFQRGARYIEDVQAYSPKSSHITDKMPQNFRYVGFIHLLLPNAKIIHCKRNPIDTCLSNFRILFGEKMEFTYDLSDLGRYYVAYSKLMEHWQKALPGKMLDVQYEDVVADMETQARRIVAHCNLDWDDECLNFYKSKRNVHTASTTQVRQPIYNNAVGRWEKYGDALSPLINSLKPVL